jgi:ABC-type transport system involved in multi-copper enzyme maturation permease subunit
MLGLTDYLWRLLPGNPILLRVVSMASKRRRDWFVRMGYLALLILLVFFSLNMNESGLDAMAKMSGQIFKNISIVQLALVALLAPIFTAGAITQEKDSQTYDILLSTPLTNAQIVIGSLGSRLFFVLALLISGIPIFSITQIFGGVAIKSIVMSFLIAAATAVVTGALAMAIATFKVGTRRTIFSFYLFIVFYLVGLYLLDQVPYFQIAGRNILPGTDARISWFTGLHPLLALQVIFNDPTYAPPEMSQLRDAGLAWWPLGWYLSSPHTFYPSFMMALSVALVMPSILLLRRMAQSSTSFRSWLLTRVRLSTGDKRRKPRPVWSNPIAWREARTKASATKASTMRAGFVLLGIGGAVAILVMHSMTVPHDRYITPASFSPGELTLTIYGNDVPQTFYVHPTTAITLSGKAVRFEDIQGERLIVVGTPTTDPKNPATLTSLALAPLARKLDADSARKWLLGLVVLEFAMILLIVTNAAASTVTREKEDGTLDLLLTTPITSRYYIWGKLRGLVSFVLPLVAVPVLSTALFVVYDFFRMLGPSRNFEWLVFPEAVLVMPATLVMSSIAIVLAACTFLGFCGFSILSTARSELALVLTSFSPFTLITVLLDPFTFAEQIYDAPQQISSARFITFIFGLVATAAYAAIVWTMYTAMVKNFDMTIRRQSR